MKTSLLTMLLLTVCSFANAQTYNANGRKVFPSPNFDEEPKSLFATSGPEVGIANLATSSPALPMAETGATKIAEGKYSEAKEALKTALRLEPMNLALWQMYDDAVIGEYTTNKRDEILKAVVEKDLLPNFAITKLDTYIELGTLYIVGTLKNTSKTTKQKIQLRARLLDENKRELRSEKGTLRSIDKILYPNESSLFEIPFKNPPTTITSYRVEVDSWE